MNEPRTYTDPATFTTGVAEGWAEAETDPTCIDWPARQAAAAIPFEVVGGRPVNPCETTAVRYGRNKMGVWGESLVADALVTCVHGGTRHLLMVLRDDGYGWAVPGGHVDPGETAVEAALRELAEETGYVAAFTDAVLEMPARYVPDPRASDEAWAVTVPVAVDLGAVAVLPAVSGGDDARRAEWVPAEDYADLSGVVARWYGGTVFAAHTDMLREFLDAGRGQPVLLDGHGVPGRVARRARVLRGPVVGRLAPCGDRPRRRGLRCRAGCVRPVAEQERVMTGIETMSAADLAAWGDARSLPDLGLLTALWLEGAIESSPGYRPGYGPDDATAPLIPVLARLNRAGLVTSAFRPGFDGEGYDGAHWKQRAAVEGYCSTETLNRLRSACRIDGWPLLIVEKATMRRYRYDRAVAVTRTDGCDPACPSRHADGCDWTRFGVIVPRRHIRHREIGYGICHRDAVNALCSAWQVTVIDPEWGRNILWDVLGSALATAGAS